MRAIVVRNPGSPEVLELTDAPIPAPPEGWVLIRVKAFGLNRSEMFTRQGHSPSVKFPRILGIECVGIVESAPGTTLQPGQTVAAIMGQMGRAYDGGYAEYTLVPGSQVIPVQTSLDWATFGALPETFLTAWGALVETAEIQSGQTLLIRGATSALGMAAATIALDAGLHVIGTTRSETKRAMLNQNGVTDVVIESGSLAAEIRQRYPTGLDHVLELVGTTTLLDSLKMVKQRGLVCFAGIVGNAWSISDFQPFEAIPSGVRLTTYNSETLTAENAARALQTIVERVEAGRYRINIDRVFKMEEIVEAHHIMDAGRASGKLVVVI